MKRLIFPLLTAALLWFLMFNPWLTLPLDFWTMMTLSGCILLMMALLIDPRWFADIEISWKGFFTGIALALVLWGIFWVGDKVATWMFPFARPQVDTIYSMKESQSEWVIGLLLLFIIGPAEEIFWRGFIQRSLSKRFTANVGFVATLLVYGLVHLWKFNFMLIMAAFVCGLVWGLAYRLWPKQLFALIVSHAIWDALVFVVWPI
ncbi:MAG: CPBP family intramembrane metalloprotease [Bacteroidaceae bacterium]|nr:CPBP family intramembrane metalloprotease [Bacteroidaceae bacterium]MBR5846226.1 CPBP family intramembrane metalloprotease [Bacteroidaceae bacterium]